MHIQWYGQTCIKIQSKIDNKEVVVVSDPFADSIGLKQPKLVADIVTVSAYEHAALDPQLVKGAEADPFMIASPGEYETNGLFVTGYNANKVADEKLEAKHTVYRYDIEGLKIAHLGLLPIKKLADEVVELLGDIDVLLLPVGGHTSLHAEEAVKVVNQIEPRIVIPMNFALDGAAPELQPVDAFAKAMGVAEVTPEKKAKIAKKDLPQENIQLIVLDKS
jgi:L-ascorbate metabolism protein UlaG (beta-lactamase superfamily)